MRALAFAAALAAFSATAALAAGALEAVQEAPAGSTEVKIAKMKFQTPEVRIKAGSAVTWTNTEALPHNVHFKSGPGVEKDVEGPMLRSNQTYSVKFNAPGTYDYICTPHPFMKGKVVVE
ncbi:amicyanin [Methylorubrum extorquens]|jgi:amicyanin|uniref:Amicyanin-alpha n=1 Tax=Methylorubrum extorquens (strain ATCC 14718 / DSM 1338 / JCM 2805 / NCIMB 9133 / AM1) TaxID=272630 RepID=AMCY_METEA|nr:amicyanin [Methylorubrum extorquens]P04172.2 RecName: Full=Amicyanin-alpha; Flags: Precursor [Methylorubrum extorquens AM1]AAA68895.1 amicyanine-alpha [Methylorubrum extorquens AM1]AAB46937.1 amicyanin [Methylorubrum extorquens AM1]ACS40532.1 Amicyanin precursor [Methylorubrum extorquens AM1]MCP1541315.1 amicyanin [Methylorubrum extorquens]MCP1586149.1 amicyanin [Methylorubrum extorquens]